MHKQFKYYLISTLKIFSADFQLAILPPCPSTLIQLIPFPTPIMSATRRKRRKSCSREKKSTREI